MADELNDKINSILNNPEAMKMLSSLVGSKSENSQSAPIQTGNDEMTSSIKNVMDRINGGSDKRINLLNALKPYMRESRAANIDRAVKMLKLTQLTSLFKDL